MTTLGMADLLISFFFGVAVCFCICMAVHRQHKKAWQAEYRRLMGGIYSARTELMSILTGHGYNMLTEGLIRNSIKKLGDL